MRTTINLPNELLARAKLLAASTNRTLTAVVEEALRAALDRPSQTGKEEPVRLVTYGGAGLHHGVDLDDSAALLEHMDSTVDPR